MPKPPNQQEGRDRDQAGKQGRDQQEEQGIQGSEPGRGPDKLGKQGRGRGKDEVEPQKGRGRKGGANVEKPTTEEAEFDRWKEDQDLEDEPQVD